jgi:hypothetical protein
MKVKNNFVVTGLTAGFVFFGSAVPSAAQACQELPGELHLISVEGSISGDDLPMEGELVKENRKRLNEKAMAICSESEFCVENASIKTTFFFNTWTKISSGSMTAVVNCLE